MVAVDSVVPGHVNPTAHEIEEGMHHAHYPAMGLSLIVATFGILFSWMVYYKKKYSADGMAKKIRFLYSLSFNKYFFDENYNRFLYKPILKLSEKVAFLDWDLYDKYFINGFCRVTEWLSRLSGKLDYDGLDQWLVDGFGRTTSGLGKKLKTIQTGQLQNYVLFALAGVVIILIVQAL